MELEKLTLKVYHPEVKEFIEKGWLYLEEEYEVCQATMSENFLDHQIDLALDRVHNCSIIQSIFSKVLTSEQIFTDILLSAAFFCDLFRYSPKGECLPEYSQIIAIGELEKITLGPQLAPVFATKWWASFKKCLLYCQGTDNPLKMLNFDKPVSDLDVIFMLGYQLQTKGIQLCPTSKPSTETSTMDTSE